MQVSASAAPEGQGNICGCRAGCPVSRAGDRRSWRVPPQSKICLRSQTRVTSHELYNDEFAGSPNTRDVGPAFLYQPVFLDQYASLAAAESLDRLSTKRGQQDVDLHHLRLRADQDQPSIRRVLPLPTAGQREPLPPRCRRCSARGCPPGWDNPSPRRRTLSRLLAGDTAQPPCTPALAGSDPAWRRCSPSR